MKAYAAPRVVTCDPSRATAKDPLGAIDDGAIVVDDGGTITFVGARSEVPRDVPVTTFDGATLTPGLVDAHTHAAFAGSRHAEYALRMAGADYREIAAAGGGILSSHRAIAGASTDDLATGLRARLRRMAALGVTTCEVKSGYGLLPDLERRQLEAVQRVAASDDVPHLVPTLLALHALPEAARASAEARASYVAGASALAEDIGRAGLAAFVDAYVDQNAFTVDEARAVIARAKAAGLAVRLHVGQFADIGGAELAAEVGARSADHLEHVSDAGIDALARSRVAAGLLPLASFTLGDPPPPVARFREAGVPILVASDANPGTAPTESLPLALAFAVRSYGLTPAEALLGATRVAATSLGVFGEGVARPRGALVPGAAADVVVWDLPHEAAIVQPWGTSKTRLVLRDGRTLASA